ncbi:centrosomal protein 72 [Planoprotostelium fungivorum]|uniref:Centrosomal protein 72 n=1 Tax=Planoprotostelium fungivorum TaxID=1890364 RepID=A0A2P6NPN8_9EUKA|nr:centrosomal protein 72 [Planoprotostelium fungivorum]
MVILTEQKVRSKAKLNSGGITQVTSLSLTGLKSDEREKITSLGRALRGFLSLKNLDLSRNKIETLEGLESLSKLTQLSLYFNCVSSLDEISRLRHNRKLRDLDLRLNPVTKTEPNYRSFVIHHLPWIKVLDDQEITESDRYHAESQYTSGRKKTQQFPEDDDDFDRELQQVVEFRKKLRSIASPQRNAEENRSIRLLDQIFPSEEKKMKKSPHDEFESRKNLRSSTPSEVVYHRPPANEPSPIRASHKNRKSHDESFDRFAEEAHLSGALNQRFGSDSRRDENLASSLLSVVALQDPHKSEGTEKSKGRNRDNQREVRDERVQSKREHYAPVEESYAKMAPSNLDGERDRQLMDEPRSRRSHDESPPKARQSILKKVDKSEVRFELGDQSSDSESLDVLDEVMDLIASFLEEKSHKQLSRDSRFKKKLKGHFDRYTQMELDRQYPPEKMTEISSFMGEVGDKVKKLEAEKERYLSEIQRLEEEVSSLRIQEARNDREPDRSRLISTIEESHR